MHIKAGKTPAMYTKGESGTRTHKECVHFNNGFCILNSMPVSPDQHACLRFTPKNATIASSAAIRYIQPPQTTQVYTQQTRTPYIRYSQTPTLQSPPPLYALSSRGAGAGGGTARGGRGRRRGRKGGFAAGPGGSCVCPKCGYVTAHTVGSPCYQQVCPRCGTPMIRQR